MSCCLRKLLCRLVVQHYKSSLNRLTYITVITLTYYINHVTSLARILQTAVFYKNSIKERCAYFRHLLLKQMYQPDQDV